MKKNYIARCGLNCGQCDAYIATINNDDELRKKTAEAWNERYKKDNRGRQPIKLEDINCLGCLSDGPVYLYCQRCKIRLCGIQKKVKNCKKCPDYRCPDLVELQKVLFKS